MSYSELTHPFPITFGNGGFLFYGVYGACKKVGWGISKLPGERLAIEQQTSNNDWR